MIALWHIDRDHGQDLDRDRGRLLRVVVHPHFGGCVTSDSSKVDSLVTSGMYGIRRESFGYDPCILVHLTLHSIVHYRVRYV